MKDQLVGIRKKLIIRILKRLWIDNQMISISFNLHQSFATYPDSSNMQP